MQKIKTWHISILVAIVSILSVSLISQYVFAAWVDPSQAPGSTGASNVVVSPMTADLDLNGSRLIDDDFVINPFGDSGFGTVNPAYKVEVVGDLNATELCISGDCKNVWPGGLWSANGSDIYFNTGKVGVGTTTPNSLLSIQQQSGNNAELAIKSTADGTSHWAIYHDRASADLRLWNSSNIMAISNEGRVGIGTIDPSYKLDVYDNSAGGLAIFGKSENSSGGVGVIGIQSNGSGVDVALGALALSGPANPSGVNTDIGVFGAVSDSEAYGVYGYNTATPGTGGNYTDKSVGVLGKGYWGLTGIGMQNGAGTNYSRGVYGTGYYGVKGEGTYGLYGVGTSSGGAGLRSVKGSSSFAADFDGTVRITNGYLQLNSTSGAPIASDCQGDSQRGRMVYDYSFNRLYVCDGASEGWKYFDVSIMLK